MTGKAIAPSGQDAIKQVSQGKPGVNPGLCFQGLSGRFCLASCPRPLIVLELELELVLGSVILGLMPVCYRVMPAALLQYRN
jgi:hypothetical protein